MQYIHLDEIGSTNTWMMRRLEDGTPVDDQTVAYTMRQTAGRGQMGNRWDSEPGKNISFSMAVHPALWHTVQPPLAVARGFVVSQIAALAVADALNGYADGFVVKWPNDVYHDDRKVAGILIENRIVGGRWQDCVVGIGINVNQMQFAADVPNAVSVRQLVVEREVALVGTTADVLQPADAARTLLAANAGVAADIGSRVPDIGPEEVLRAVCSRMAGYFAQLRADAAAATERIHQRYMDSLYRREGFHSYADVGTGERFAARIEGIAPDGRMTLATRDGARRVYWFKEVHFVLPGGLRRE